MEILKINWVSIAQRHSLKLQKILQSFYIGIAVIISTITQLNSVFILFPAEQ